MIKTLKVTTPLKKYNIIIGNNIIASSGKYSKKYLKSDRVFIVTNKLLKSLYLKKIKNSFVKHGITVSEIIINDSESKKNLESVKILTSHLLKNKVDRNDTLIALGGGVIGDLVGFVASITLRGINFIQIPTTLLSQVDSSVGGKTGVNTPLGKNLIGSFYQPALVISDVGILKSLNKREVLSGYAEVIKYGIIMDKAFFNWLLKNDKHFLNQNANYLIEIVYKSCKNKAKIVNQDEKEKNIRALLNLGHTFGHAIEALNNYKKTVVHGEAVAIGIIMALELSFLEGKISKDIINKIESHFDKIGIKRKIPNQLKRHLNTSQFIEAMSSDKKVKNKKINLILCKSIGEAYITDTFKHKNMKKVIKDFLN